ncbi:hypothetical protein LAZ67_6004045 [Cordylochernes scorpioides]|uniref:PiggyBac transposable element-derived protein domain-containing protein n=1 Tax=Cordylochernes scorpioides TaxID=51811 RepID=A0ABY6KL74_9ARAC|nr:hypothetical protein LAZ67_6004045 [Cordylochernes scorpioides]
MILNPSWNMKTKNLVHLQLPVSMWGETRQRGERPVNGKVQRSTIKSFSKPLRSIIRKHASQSPETMSFFSLNMASMSSWPPIEEEEIDTINCDLSDTSDTEIYSLHNTDSEQETDNEEEHQFDGTKFYIGKDGTSMWKKTVWRSTQVRTRSVNIISQWPGLKPEAKSIISESDAFIKLIDLQMIQNIVECTNIYINIVQRNFSRERDAQVTTVSEILSLLGLLLISGVKRHLTYKELWALDGTGLAIMRAVMSQERFLFLLRCLRFDNIHTRIGRKKEDKLAAIRDFVESFIVNCKKLYTPGSYMTIDEKLVPFRGRCDFKQYLQGKPAKYGLKVYALCDARTFYTLNLEVYCGKQPEGSYQKSNTPSDIVKRLITPISGTHRNITTDTWCTSFPLAQELLENNKLTLVGTLRKNMKEIPKEFLPNRSRPIYSSLFGFNQDKSIVSYVPKRNKAVMLLSTMHSTPTIDEESGDRLKPEIVTFYNQTKCGVDVMDQMCDTYSVSRRTNRWSLCLFFNVINIAGINSEVIFKALTNNPKPNPRRIFLKNVALQLCQDHLKVRAQLKNLPRSLRDLISFHCKEAEGTQVEEISVSEPEPKRRKRCYVCPCTKNRMSTMTCCKCNKNICKEHSNQICQNCQ